MPIIEPGLLKVILASGELRQVVITLFVVAILAIVRQLTGAWIARRHRADEYKYSSSDQWRNVAERLQSENSDIRDKGLRYLVDRMNAMEKVNEGLRVQAVKLQSKHLLSLTTSEQQRSIIARLEKTVEVQAKQIDALERAVGNK